MKKLLKAWQGSWVIFFLGGGLSVAHLTHITVKGETTHSIVLGIILPVLISIVVLLGGVWLQRSSFSPAASRRVGGWCLFGVLLLSLDALISISSQQAHGVELADQGFFVLQSTSFGSLIGFVVGVYDTQRHQQRQEILSNEQALSGLHETTRKLIQSSDRQEIVTYAVETANDILGLHISTCWLYDEDREALIPVASTDDANTLLGEPPTYADGGSLSWEAFETGEVLIFDDVRDTQDRYNPDTPIRSEIILPLGEHGVMNIGSTETGMFGEMDISLARILAANTQTALDRADREQELATTRDEATQLNRQLTVLNRIFRHDIRNSANVINGHAELLAKNTDDKTIEKSAETIQEQAVDLVKMGEQVRDIERLFQSDGQQRETVDLVDIIESQLARVQRDFPSADTNEPATDSCSVRAHPLVESAVRNVIENAVEHNDVETPHVDVTISQADSETVELRVADNGPGIPENETKVLEREYETPIEHTSGLGLWLVNWIVRESGGEVCFSENSPRGSIVSLQFKKAIVGDQADNKPLHH